MQSEGQSKDHEVLLFALFIEYLESDHKVDGLEVKNTRDVI